MLYDRSFFDTSDCVGEDTVDDLEEFWLFELMTDDKDIFADDDDDGEDDNDDDY